MRSLMLFGISISASVAAWVIFCFPALASVEKLSISNLVVVDGQGSAIETKVYPGYTMSFDVAVVSSYAEGEPVKFEYAIIDQHGKTVYLISEERKLSGEDVFTKKVALPRSIQEGDYRLKITSNAGGKEVVQQLPFEIVRSPITQVKEKNQATLISLFGPNSWLLGVVLIVVALALIISGIILLHKRKRISGKRM